MGDPDVGVSAREATPMQTALRIAGREIPAHSGATFERRNPISGEIATRAAAATVTDALAAADAAAAAFPIWSATDRPEADPRGA